MKNISNNLYDSQGYINVPEIAARPTWLKVLIGARQVGKTYGVLKYYLESGDKFILMRRTTEELKFIAANQQLNPFQPFEPDYHVTMINSGGSFDIVDYDPEDGKSTGHVRGIGLSLPMVSHIRGFNGSPFKAIIFDEAVPEKGVRVLKSEGDSLLNAYTTINGNRELQGKEPITLWLLCNTNNINSRILESLNLIDDIVWMRSKGLEYLEKGDVSIFQGYSTKIIEQRKDTALARQISDTSNFAKMAFNNEWSYDDSPLIKVRSIKGLTPVCSYDDTIYFWEDAAGIYACTAPHKIERYGGGNFDTEKFIGSYIWMKRWYQEGLITFSNLKLLAVFKRLFELDY